MIGRIVRVALTVLLLAGLAWSAQNAYFLHLAKTEYTLFTTLLSVTVVLVSLRHSFRDLALLALATALFLAIASRPDHFHFGLPLALSVLGLASMAILGVTAFWASREFRPALLWGFCVSLTLVSSGWVLPIFLNWVAKNNPKSFDLYLLSFDASLRFQPSFLLGQAFARWPLFARLSMAFYMGIICLCTLVFTDQLKRDVKRAVPVFAPFLFCSPIGVLYYNLFPARGPLYLLGPDFPSHPLSLDAIRHLRLEPVVVYGFPNAMPSLHMTWALLAFCFSRGGSRWVRAVASLFLVFTIISTLGTGEHYLVDLVVAFPFSLMIEALFAFHIPWSNPWRIRSVVFGASAPVLWMTMLRFQPGYFWVSPLTPWALIVATVGATLYIERHLSDMPQSETTVPEAVIQEPEPILSTRADG